MCGARDRSFVALRRRVECDTAEGAMRLGVIQRWLVVPTLALVGALVLPAALMLARVSVCEPMRGGGFYRAGSFSLEAYWRLLSVDGANLIGFTVVFAVAVALGVVVLACSFVCQPSSSSSCTMHRPDLLRTLDLVDL